jgi:hypothetical protein
MALSLVHGIQKYSSFPVRFSKLFIEGEVYMQYNMRKVINICCTPGSTFSETGEIAVCHFFVYNFLQIV